MRLATVMVTLLAGVLQTTAWEYPVLLRDAVTAYSAVPSRAPLSIERPVTRAVTLNFTHLAVAYDGQPVEAGSLVCDGWFNPASLNNAGQITFQAHVAGQERNQAMFLANAAGLQVVAMGCGGIGGSGVPGDCGDPTPIGGTFAGLFGGSFIVPAINDNGDVLFLADVYQGSAPRGLFLYRAPEGDIVKVAAVGDPSPLGGELPR